MDATDHQTLRGYLDVVRRRRVVFLVVIAAAAAAGYLLSHGRAPSYSATASVHVQEPTDSAPLGGVQAVPGEFPQQTAAQAAETATRPEVLDRVRRSLRLRDATDTIKGRLDISQDARSNLVTITASARTGQGAAALANAVAHESSAASNTLARRRFAALAADVRRKAATITVSRKQLKTRDPAKRVKLNEKLRRRQKLNDTATNLDTLAQVTAVSQVARDATVPKSPSSPKPVRDAILAGIAGALLALLLAVALESLDRRLRRPDEARELLGLPLVGVVPERVLGHVPTGEARADVRMAAMEVFRMLRTNLDFLDVDESPRVVLVTSPVPEEGKTSVASGVALAAAAGGRRTLLIEGDLHRPVHAARLGIAAAPGLVDHLTEHAALGDIVQRLEFVDPGMVITNGSAPPTAELFCLTAGRATAWSGELLSSKRFADLLERLRTDYELVLIDSPPLLAAAETLELVRVVDAVLYCVRLGRTTIEQARVGREVLQRLPPHPTGLVVTGAKGGQAGGYAYYSYAYKYRSGRRSKALT
jgi:Mrp family chromosome partitioning ATPase